MGLLVSESFVCLFVLGGRRRDMGVLEIEEGVNKNALTFLVKTGNCNQIISKW